jgi:2-desacetyl-2-hydroxyethyl bacteriochlorophyllide A dehydrogenase
MKAMRYDGPHRMTVVDLPEPSPAAGEVVVRVKACGICGSDVHGYTGESGRRTAGQVMGHEFSGEIASVGSGVSGWKLGDRVAVFNLFGCGDCSFCRASQPQCCPGKKLIGVNTGTAGAFAERVAVKSNHLSKLAPSISFDQAILNEPLSVAYHALRHIPESAESILIVGGGTIGLCLTIVAKAMGKKRIFLFEPIESKRALATRFGAVAMASNIDELRKHEPSLPDAAVEAVGIESTVQLALEAIAPSGTLVLLGNLAKTVSIPLQHVSSGEKKLVGSYGFNRADFDQVMTWLNAGKFDLDPLLSGECSLDEAPAVFEDLAIGKRQAIKIVVRP